MNSQAKHTVSIANSTARIDWYLAPTLQDMIGAIRGIVRSSHFHPDLQLLIVDHATDFNFHAPQIREAVEALAPHVRKFLSVAYSVQTDNHYGIANQFRVHFLMAGIAMEVFRNEAAAG